jgi:hypothetical protein
MKADLFEVEQLFEIRIDGEIDTIFVDRALLCAARGISENLADVGDRDLDALLLKGELKADLASALPSGSGHRRNFDGL